MKRPRPTLLDGPLGSELTRRGADTSPPLWSARPMRDKPELVAEVHQAHRQAGAEVLRTNTFRTRPRTLGGDWERVARSATRVARSAARGARIAGSVGPLEDCYHPERSPGAGARREHEALADLLHAEGVDLLVCEGFAHPIEASVAVEACARTGREVWLGLTAGPSGELLNPRAMKEVGRSAAASGAHAILVHCIAVDLITPYVEELASLGVPFGVYANAARWHAPPIERDRYLAEVERWLAMEVDIVGACCGTDPDTYAEIAVRVRKERERREGAGSPRGSPPGSPR